MKSQYIDELKPGQSVKESFILSKKTLKEKKDGGVFATLEFTDRSGSIEGIAWDAAVHDVDILSTGDFVFVTGTVNEYNERLQIVVQSMYRVADDAIDPQDFLPRSDKNIDEVMAHIEQLRAGVTNPFLKKLLDMFFGDASFVEQFRLAPAAKRVHHAYLGGLAVHTLNVARLMINLETIYGSLDASLLVTAALLHDIGKIHEYTYAKKLDVSTKGKMLGHIMIGYEMIVEKLNRIPKFPEDLRLKLLHMILSHHGEFEWGSPKLPLFLEALVLHFADNLDSKAEMMIAELKKYRGEEKEWSDYHPYLEREIYLGEP